MTVPLVRQPDACLWCLTPTTGVASDMSHVIPASCGNEELVLPPPIVCKHCNRSFQKVEQAFAEEPLFNFQASTLGVVHGRTGRRFSHDRYGLGDLITSQAEPRDIRVEMDEKLVAATALEYEVDVVVNGDCARIPVNRLESTARRLTFLSRAVHKMLLEWYANCYYVKGYDIPSPSHAIFNDVRAYARRGYPPNYVRPYLRFHAGISDAMDLYFVPTPEIVLEMDLLGTHYCGALTGARSDVLKALYGRANAIAHRSLLIANPVEVIDHGPHTTVGTWFPKGT